MGRTGTVCKEEEKRVKNGEKKGIWVGNGEIRV